MAQPARLAQTHWPDLLDHSSCTVYSPGTPRLPRADVADFAVRIIIPARAGNGVGNRLAQFVRTCRSQGVRGTEAAKASATSGKGHDRVEDGPADIVVVAAEGRARRRAALDDATPGGRYTK